MPLFRGFLKINGMPTGSIPPGLYAFVAHFVRVLHDHPVAQGIQLFALGIEPKACGARQWEEDHYTPIVEIARAEGSIIKPDAIEGTIQT